jgi:hypothetical protein
MINMKLANAVMWWTPARSTHKHAGRVIISERGAAYPALEIDASIIDFMKPTCVEDELRRMFHIFHLMVVRDAISPMVAHNAFLVIDEYRQNINPDIDGADNEADVCCTEQHTGT